MFLLLFSWSMACFIVTISTSLQGMLDLICSLKLFNEDLPVCTMHCYTLPQQYTMTSGRREKTLIVYFLF